MNRVALVIYLLAFWSATLAAKSLEMRSERGPVSVVVKLDVDKPLIGDPVTLDLEVTAEADVEVLMPEFGQSLDRFAIIEFVPRQHIDSAGRTVASQRYILSPPLSGEQRIPPISIEFVDRRTGKRPAPEGEDAYEVLTEALEFTVQSVLPDDADADLKPPLGTLAPRIETVPTPWWWWLLGLLLFVLIIALAIRLLLYGLALSRRRSAYDIAHARLAKLVGQTRPDAARMDAFFVELSDIVRHYLEDRFKLHAPEFTTEEFLEVVSGSPDLNKAHQGFLRDFLQQADQVKFAQHVPGADYIEEILAAAGNFLTQTRETTAKGMA